jgi:hypothetical protein
MNKDQLFSHLKKQKPSVLIQLLDDCYSGMKTRAIGEVFGHLENEFEDKPVEGKKVLKSVKKFVNDSLKGKYYAPFNVNSKNFMDIPEETDMWFEELADLLTDSSELSAQGEHIHAVNASKPCLH